MSALESILIVDDEPAVRNVMSRWVAGLGLNPRTAANADEALATLHAHHCELAVIDVMMPGRDGLWLASELRREHPHTAVVLATAYTELLNGDAQPPIADLLVKPFPRERFMLAVKRGRQWRKEAIDEVLWLAQLSRELRDRTDQVCRYLALDAEEHGTEMQALVALATERTPEAMAHGERVARYAEEMAHELALSDAGRRTLEAAARLHDIGKIVMPEALLTKPSALSQSEQLIMRCRVDAGAEILLATRTLQELAPVVLRSQEWFNGGGYPGRLVGEAIPLGSRIIAVVDAYDSMTQLRRPGRELLDSADAVAELVRCSKRQFDPSLVASFLTVLGHGGSRGPALRTWP